MDKIMIFGTGSVGQKLYTMLDSSKVEILAFINSDTDMINFHQYNIVHPSRIAEFDYDYILVASGYYMAIKKSLLEYGVPEEKIVTYIYDDECTYLEIQKMINDGIDQAYNRNKVLEWVNDGKNIPQFYPAIMWDETRNITKFHKDFVREQTVKLISCQFEEKNISGSVAELGVFRGDFTVVLDEIFSNRKLFLYDTFEGFNADDVKNDATIENVGGESEKFRNTSVDYVLNRLKNKDVVVKKGYFPDSFAEDSEEFCFVSLDFNLVAPTRAALDVFYPKLVKGGFILVSCYYAPYYDGTRVAVNEWCEQNGLTPIPVADYYGSVLIQKQ